MILISLWNNKTKTQEKHQMTKLKTSKRNNTIIVHTTISLSASRSTIGSIKYLQITWKNGCYAEFSSLLLLGGVWSSLLSKANNYKRKLTFIKTKKRIKVRAWFTKPKKGRKRKWTNTGSDESAVVLHPFVGTSSWLLLLVLFSNLWCLASHLTGTSQGSMNLTWKLITWMKKQSNMEH